MNEGDVIEVLRHGFVATLLVAGPPLLAALVTGVAVSFLQALTQIQEVTLSYVPKIVVTMVVVMLSLPLGFAALRSYTEEIAQMIVGL
ncbi:flagellar biosynthetic protein FliQ [Pseudoroseomonas wenyumeiae]|uniref:Flagellar biosynthetic protein FliQ n=1 Tax=Teichococcus wenyumeiae TaxID=2478470 RepID=A0A3A9JEW3_9PROT|nr:flagellar biosynthetic protein FliQ [Pseudoroseomonas wenyumeiae]RKK03095.1 flagellar biosynthetic protein FliQ [Pseudoroseomonas wenyumeiae]RMI20117.1 flagellar biosynthetic protein FliQ [Pseudoroseomonas wenyumeiae]